MQPAGLNTQEPSINVLETRGTFDPGCALTEVRLPDGRVVSLETRLFVAPRVVTGDAEGTQERIVIPLIQEQLEIGKQTVETARVRLVKTVETYTETLDEPLAVREFDIERVILNRPVEYAPVVREEGPTTIYSLVEEQMILTKQLILREEVRVTKRDTVRRDRQTVTLTREHIGVEREVL